MKRDTTRPEGRFDAPDLSIEDLERHVARARVLRSRYAGELIGNAFRGARRSIHDTFSHPKAVSDH